MSSIHLSSLLTLLESMINVKQRQVISIDVCKTHLSLICLFLHLIGSHKTLRDFKRSKEKQEEKWTQQTSCTNGNGHWSFVKKISNLLSAIHTSGKSIKVCQTIGNQVNWENCTKRKFCKTNQRPYPIT